MKDPRKPFKPHLLQLLQEGREKAAASFLPDALREALTESAKKGLSVVRVVPAGPVKVKGTSAASAGLAFLDRLELRYQWESMGGADDYDVLVVLLDV